MKRFLFVLGVLLMSLTARAQQSPPNTSIAADTARTPKIINMVDAGATGSGDLSSVVKKIIDNAPDGSTFFFPAGTYRMNSLDFANRNNLTFRGENRDKTTILWNGTGSSQIMRFKNIRGMTWENIAVNNKGISAFGGIQHYSVHDVTYRNCRFYDDASIGVTEKDRYSLVFGGGGIGTHHTNIVVENNLIENLQLSVDHTRGAIIRGNTSTGACCTASIGSWANDHNSVHENFLVENNTINNPIRAPGGAITFRLDRPSLNFASFRNITIRNNVINMTKISKPGITLGGPIGPVQGVVFDGITIENNKINYTTETGLADDEGVIYLFTLDSMWPYAKMVIKGNIITAAKPVRGIGIAARRLVDSRVEGNRIVNFSSGIQISQNTTQNTAITDNDVKGSSYAAYRLDTIGTGNSLVNNSYSVPFTTVLRQENVPPGNRIEEPKQLIQK
jgi:hypothetical protein